MKQTLNGKTVTRVRDAREGDPGFLKGTDQVVATLEDGSQKTVKRAEVKEDAE